MVDIRNNVGMQWLKKCENKMFQKIDNYINYIDFFYNKKRLQFGTLALILFIKNHNFVNE